MKTDDVQKSEQHEATEDASAAPARVHAVGAPINESDAEATRIPPPLDSAFPATVAVLEDESDVGGPVTIRILD